MYLILWLKFFFISLTMPGAFIFILKKISFLQYKDMGTLYLYVLFIFQIIGSLYCKKGILTLIVIILGIIIPLVIELNLVNIKKVYKFIIEIIIDNKPIFIFPILEELNFRFLIYIIGCKLNITITGFIIISSLSFGISHIPYLGIKSIYKIIQGIFLSLIFIYFGLSFSIICHSLFNIFVYLYKKQQNQYIN